jgi:hypothetical protein
MGIRLKRLGTGYYEVKIGRAMYTIESSKQNPDLTYKTDWLVSWTGVNSDSAIFNSLSDAREFLTRELERTSEKMKLYGYDE